MQAMAWVHGVYNTARNFGSNIFAVYRSIQLLRAPRTVRVMVIYKHFKNAKSLTFTR